MRADDAGNQMSFRNILDLASAVGVVAVVRSQQASESRLGSLLETMGHPSNHALARAIRVTGGSAAAVRAALQLRCDVCESQQHPGPHLSARLRTDREFGDTAAIDLFVLADYEGNQLSFVNILDLASTFVVVAMIPSKHPKIDVWKSLP